MLNIGFVLAVDADSNRHTSQRSINMAKSTALERLWNCGHITTGRDISGNAAQEWQPRTNESEITSGAAMSVRTYQVPCL